MDQVNNAFNLALHGRNLQFQSRLNPNCFTFSRCRRGAPTGDGATIVKNACLLLAFAFVREIPSLAERRTSPGSRTEIYCFCVRVLNTTITFFHAQSISNFLLLITRPDTDDICVLSCLCGRLAGALESRFVFLFGYALSPPAFESKFTLNRRIL